MARMTALLRDGCLAMVSDDWDDAGVWEAARDAGCVHVVMLPDGLEWLQEHCAGSFGWLPMCIGPCPHCGGSDPFCPHVCPCARCDEARA